VVANLHVTLPGSFARERDLIVPRDDMLRTLEAAAGGAARVHKCDFRALAAALAGDAVYANLLCLGFAYQKALIPVPEWSVFCMCVRASAWLRHLIRETPEA
jgi:indolepyruvate ferredoxin oxidoreductase